MLKRVNTRVKTCVKLYYYNVKYTYLKYVYSKTTHEVPKMANEKTNTQKPTTKANKTIANVFEEQALLGGTKKQLALKIVQILKDNGQAKTKKGNLMEVAVPRQINAMLSEVGKKGRWKAFKQVGKDEQIKLEKITAL